jgi:hypothetical protein
MASEADIRQRYEQLRPHLDERQRRLWAASEAQAIGRGGLTLVARAIGMSRRVVSAGVRELDAPEPLPVGRCRRAGGGRKGAEVADPAVWPALESLVAPTACGDPMNPLQWSLKSVRRLTSELLAAGHRVGRTAVWKLLRAHDYRLQANRKSLEDADHPDRNAQFEYINARMQSHLAANEPGVSVDGKKKELVGQFKNGGRDWRPEGQPEEVLVHDFVDQDLGRAAPYGVYDLAANQGWVSVGISHDTAAFAVATLRRWWQELGRSRYPAATRLLVCADGGGSNGPRLRLWKVELQKFADESNLAVTVCHYPRGTSKWNKIEHRLFSFITLNWRGRPLVSYQTIVSLIGATTTREGLSVWCELDPAEYPTKVQVSDEQLAAVRLKRHDFHGDWNYTIEPHAWPE